MVSNAVFLAACIVPPVCLVAVIAWTWWILRRIRRLSQAPAPVPAPILPPASLPLTLAFTPSPPHLVPPFHPAPSPSGTLSVLRSDLYAALPPPPPAPPEPRFSIRTTLAPDGSRVLSRAPTSSGGHGSSSHGGPATDESARSKPERARKDAKRFGIGDVDSERSWALVQALDAVLDAPGGYGDADEADRTIRPGRALPQLRRRGSTWSAQDWEPVLSPANSVPPLSASYPHSSAALSAVSANSDGARRPLPPGAAYEASNTPTSEDEPVPPSVAPTSGRSADGGAPDAPETLVNPPVSPRPVSDDMSISARSSRFFGTTVVPLPPPTPSQSSHSHDTNGGRHRQSAWSDSTYEAVFTDFPARTSLLHPRRTSAVQGSSYCPGALPSPLEAHSYRSATFPRSSGSTAALEELENYANSLSSGISPTYGGPSGTVAAGGALLGRTHSRRKGSAPWFAAAAQEPARLRDASATRERADDLIADTEKRDEPGQRVAKASRPISWLVRQNSEGSLDDVPHFGGLALVNPDEGSLRGSESSSRALN
ncbi:hypothetical protein Rhopal_004015-T1 [Rhodotorula paludigena]|uniref:Proteophosphoglycan ppg4 n=1 Tax=Rhodotorula paludigena TaxID=86838 RepID=A0AAV5GN82_9BASI|nr:hypothetical protein Rhopal_004015-T1 [Rhodotorula paludigena]